MLLFVCDLHTTNQKTKVSCGDLDESEEYLNTVIFDFLWFASEAALGGPVGDSFLIKCAMSRSSRHEREAPEFSTNIPLGCYVMTGTIKSSLCVSSTKTC